VSTLSNVPRACVIAVLTVAVTACGADDSAPPSLRTAVVDVLDRIVLSEVEPPTETTFFREREGSSSATRLAQDSGAEIQIAVQHGLVGALTREFGTPGVIAMLEAGAPTESLDPARDVWIASAVAAYEDRATAREALSAFLEATNARLERRRNIVFGDGGTVFRGRFLRGMPIVTYLWQSERFVLHLTAVGALDHAEIRAIARGMDDRTP
jgi:hypothetical protein